MDPFELLGLPADADAPAIKARWRELLHSIHPDVGGDTVTFMALRDAYNEALNAAATRPCPRCGGTGTTDNGRLKEVCPCATHR